MTAKILRNNIHKPKVMNPATKLSEYPKPKRDAAEELFAHAELKACGD
jgi:hypothetical protein